MRALLAGIALLSALLSIPPAQAEDTKPIRVIPITRENAEASAALIKSPPIGRPPVGRTVQQAGAPQQAARQTNWKDARAEIAEQPRPRAERNARRVEIWKPTGSGGFYIEAYSVPAERPSTHGY